MPTNEPPVAYRSGQLPVALLTIKEVAATLKVDPVTVRRRIASGELQALRVGTDGGIRVPVQSLAALLRPVAGGDA